MSNDNGSEPAKVYTLEEVAKHKTEDDCWVVIHGQVLDIKEFLSIHPGGDDILLEGAVSII